MDQESAPRYEQGVANQSRAILLSEDQFNRFLELLERRRDLVDSLHTLTDPQKLAVAAFERAAVSMGMRGFGPPARPVTRQDGAIVILVPEKATHARVYSRSGVRDADVQGKASSFVVKGVGPADRVGRVEFFDASGVLLEVTGGEPEPNPAAQPA